jgi:hypothetical protein
LFYSRVYSPFRFSLKHRASALDQADQDCNHCQYKQDVDEAA